MTKRRPKGSGTIRRTPEGKFRALFSFTGKRRDEIDGSPFATYEDAAGALDAILTRLRDSGATRGGPTLRRVGSTCLDRREKAGYRAVDSERDRWDAYVDTHPLADEPICLITKGGVRDLLGGLRNQKTGEPLATQTKKNVLNLLRAVFGCAVDDGILDDNLLAGMKVKDVGSTSDLIMRPLSWPQAQALLDVATDPIVALAIGTGMRSGELRALRWEHVNLDKRAPHILCQLGSPPKRPRKNGKVLRIPLFGMALKTLTALSSKLRKEERTGTIFRSKTGCYRTKGRAVEPDSWKAWLAEAGIERRVRFHDLRHTCATLLLNGDLGRKWSYEEVKELLGHSSVKVTERYAKVLGTLAEGAAAEMRKSTTRSRKKLPNKGGNGAAPNASERIQALRIIERRGSDSNRRMTVLQSGDTPNDPACFDDVALLCRSIIEIAADGGDFAWTKVIELVSAAWDQADRSRPMNAYDLDSRCPDHELRRAGR